MGGVELMVAFGLATVVFGYMPGPGMLYATARTLGEGRRAGFAAVIGLHVGGYVHVVAAAFGLALVFQALPVLYLVLKSGGAVYLMYLGLRLIFGREQGEGPYRAGLQGTARGRAFWQSVGVEVLNPKTAIFYLGFLPQFTDAAAAFPVWVQFLILGTVVNVVFSSADVLCVLLADRVARMLVRRQGAGRWLRRSGGAVLIGLGLGLMFGQR